MRIAIDGPELTDVNPVGYHTLYNIMKFLWEGILWGWWGGGGGGGIPGFSKH